MGGGDLLNDFSFLVAIPQKLISLIIESFTADHKPLLGPDVNLRGYYHNCGYNSSGIMLAGGCGNELAKWVVHGHTDLDMWSYDIRYIEEC